MERRSIEIGGGIKIHMGVHGPDVGSVGWKLGRSHQSLESANTCHSHRRQAKPLAARNGDEKTPTKSRNVGCLSEAIGSHKL